MPSEKSWHAARLIPTSGIKGPDEQEWRATSALLAVMTAVKELSRALLRPLGAPSGATETFIEVPFDLGERRATPDGLIRVMRGQKTWTALVEVKTGRNILQSEQLECYLDVAKEQGFDAVITISNEIPAISGTHPTAIDKRKTKKVSLHHWPWSEILTEAILQKEHRGIDDPEQAWILGELIRYLEHPKSGALEFEDMGPSWVAIRDSVVAGTFRSSNRGASEVVNRFDALLRFTGLRLGRRLGTDVTTVVSRREATDPALRASALLQQLTESGRLTGAIRVPDTVAPIVAAELLREVRNNPALLVPDPKKELKSFRVAQLFKLGSKGSNGRGSFIESVTSAVDRFYEDVVQDVRAWRATPPRLRNEEAELRLPDDVPRALVSTAMSSQDDAESAADVVAGTVAADEVPQDQR